MLRNWLGSSGRGSWHSHFNQGQFKGQTRMASDLKVGQRPGERRNSLGGKSKLRTTLGV